MSLELNRHKGNPIQTLVDELGRSSPVLNSDVGAYAHLQLGTSLVGLGQFESAATDLKHAIALAELRSRFSTSLAAITELATAAGLDGDIKGMVEYSNSALAYGNRHHLTHSPEYKNCLTTAALTAYLRGESRPPVSGTPITRSTVATTQYSYRAPGSLAALIGGLYESERDPTSRHASVARVRDAAIDAIAEKTSQILTSALLPIAVQSCLGVGETEWADRLLHDAVHEFGEAAELNLARALVRFATGRLKESRESLIVAHSSRDQLHLINDIYLLALEAVTAAAENKPRDAFGALRSALTIAEPGQVLRPFLDLAGPLRPLLDEFTTRFDEQESFAQSVRARMSPVTTTPQLLTPAEQHVLLHLGAGGTTGEIADALFLSVNTIKTHLRGIYRKFDVTSRRDAIRAARKHGFL